MIDAIAIGQLSAHSLVVSADTVNALRWWDVATGELLGEWSVGDLSEPRLLPGSIGAAVAVAEVDGRPVVVSAGENGMIRCWDPATGRLRAEFPSGCKIGTEQLITAMAVAELDGRPVVVTHHVNGTLRRWDLSAGKPLGRPLAHRRAGRPLARDDGSTVYLEYVTVRVMALGEIGGRQVLICPAIDGTVRCRDLATWKPLGKPLVGHETLVSAVAMREVDGRPAVVSADEHGTVRRWNVASGVVDGSLEVDSSVTGLTMTDQDTVVITSAMGLALLRFLPSAAAAT